MKLKAGLKSLRAAAGFTLLEVMIALMIVAVALPALLSLVVTQLDGAAGIRDKTYAYWVAENQLTRISLLQQLKMQQKLMNYQLPEKDSGITNLAGLSWRWQMQTIAMESLPMPGFKRIEITVSLEGVAKKIQMGGSAQFSDHESALARLTGYISDPEKQPAGP
jgi:general secretion pathway protein I